MSEQKVKRWNTCRPGSMFEVPIDADPAYVLAADFERVEADLADATECYDELHISWLRIGDEARASAARIAALEKALRRIANGDPNQVSTPLGPWHHAGMVMQWEIDRDICRAALGPPT